MTASQIARSGGIYAGVTVAIIASTAGITAVSGLADEVRRAFGLPFDGADRSAAQAMSIAADNARLATGVLLCSVLRSRLRRGRLAVDGALLVVLVLNAGLVGAALGGYGRPAVAALSPHLPLELAALSLCAGAYSTARDEPPSLAALWPAAVTATGLILVAAALETYVQIGARP